MQTPYQKKQRGARLGTWLAWLAILSTLVALIILHALNERSHLRESGMRTATFLAAGQASLVSDRLRETFSVLFDAGRDRVETPFLDEPLNRVKKQRWDHLLSGEFVVLAASEKGGGGASFQKDAPFWNLSRFPEPNGRILAWIDERTQLSFLAASSSQKTVIMALAPALIAQFLGNALEAADPNVTPGASHQGEVQLALLARPDALVLTHSRNRSLRPEALATTDSIRISEAVLAQPAVARLVSSPGGSSVLEASSHEALAAAFPARGSNLVAFSLAQSPAALVFSAFLNGPSLIAFVALALSLLLLVLAQRGLLKNSLAASQHLWLNKMQEASRELYAFKAMSLRLSEWQSDFLGGQSVSFTASPPQHAFGDPSQPSEFGYTELSANWAGRLLFSDLGLPGFTLVALVEGPSPLREMLCIFIEGLVRKPILSESDEESADLKDLGFWQKWGQSQSEAIDKALSLLAPEERSSLKCASFFVWSAVTGVVWQHGEQAVAVRHTDSWDYLALVTRRAETGEAEEILIGGPLVVWRSLAAEATPSSVAEAPPDGTDGADVKANQGNASEVHNAQALPQAGPSEPSGSVNSEEEPDDPLHRQTNPKQGAKSPRTACHWLAVLLTGVAALMCGWLPLPARAAEAGVASGGAAPPGEAVNQKEAETTPAAPPAAPLPPLNQRGFLVTELHGHVRARLPTGLAFFELQKGGLLPMGAELVISPSDASLFSLKKRDEQKEPFVTLRHRIHGLVEFKGAGQHLLNPDYFAQNLSGIRFTETEDIPARVELKQSEVYSPLERLFAFFIPRRDLPAQFDGVARSENQQRFPLVVSYPERVHLIKTNTLPVVVSMEWIGVKEHKRPYRVYLWNEQESISAPVRRVSGTGASVQLAEHGRFYWQVEDDSGNFISSPRTIILSPLDDPLNADAGDEKLRPTRPSVLRELRPVPVVFPTQNALVYGCPERGDTEIPVRFHHHVEEGVKSPALYQISFLPNREKKLVELKAPAQSEILLAQLPLPSDGTFAFKIVGFDSSDQAEDRKILAASDKIRGTFLRTCGLGKKPDFLVQAFRVSKGKELPAVGLMHFMDGAL